MADGDRTTRRRLAEALLLGALLLVLANRFLLAAWRQNGMAPLREVFLQYKAATLAVDFVDFGAVPRGLGGSLARLFSPDAVDAVMAFHVASALGAACVLALLFATFQASAVRRAAVALVALALMLRWGEDGARTDLAVVALLGIATLAWRSGRLVAAAGTIGIGLFLHEGSVIVGLPLLAALAWRDASRGPLDWQRVRAPILVLGGFLALYAVLGWLPRSTNLEIATRVRERVGDNEAVDVALYFALAGFRGVRAAMCQNGMDPASTLHVATGLVAIALAGGALVPWRSARPGMLLLAALPGYVLLTQVANDHARWTLFACIALWLFAVSAPGAARASFGRTVVAADVACLAASVLLVLALVPSTRPGIPRVVSPVPLVDQWLDRGPPRKPLGFAEVVERCDPRWRDVLGPGR